MSIKTKGQFQNQEFRDNQENIDLGVEGEAKRVVLFGEDGSTISDILEGYKITDKDDDATPNYYGYTDKDGNWYILKEVVSPGADTYRYAKGTSDYTTNWTGRAGLSYDYFYNVF